MNLLGYGHLTSSLRYRVKSFLELMSMIQLKRKWSLHFINLIFHGDVRSMNVLVRHDQSVVLVNFEQSVLNANEMMLVKEMLHMLMTRRERQSLIVRRC